MKQRNFRDMFKECHNVELAKALSFRYCKYNSNMETTLPSSERTLYSQGKTSTCWLSSTLFCISVFLKKNKNVNISKETTLSKSYLIFYDKIERTKRFLSMIDSNVKDQQNIRYLLNHLVTDRGQWNMAQNLILKYGVIPYEAMPDPFHQISSADLNAAINNLLRIYAVNVMKGISAIERHRMKKNIMNIVESMLVQIFGVPPSTIIVPKEFDCEERISPLEFFQKYISFPFEDYLFICNFAQKTNSYYEVIGDNNIEEGTAEILLNLSDSDFYYAIFEQLKKDGFCWYTCDASKGFCKEKYFYDCPDYSDIIFETKKYDMVKSRIASPNHAMVLVNDIIDSSENSWIMSHNSKGELKYGNFIPVSKEWLKQYSFQAVVNKHNIGIDLSDLPYYKITPFDLYHIA